MPSYTAQLVLEKNDTLSCLGHWTLENITNLKNHLPAQRTEGESLKITGGDIQKMDSAGAFLLNQIIQRLQESGCQIELLFFKKNHRDLLDLISKHAIDSGMAIQKTKKTSLLFRVGEQAVKKYGQVKGFLAFIGELFFIVFRNLKTPYKIQWRSVLKIIDETGYCALPIIALLLFLIGIVLAYQMGLQLKTYGANIFIVNLTGIAILREFSPLITAIIIAGRTSSSFAALIGTMKVYEEIDAITVMGLSPINRLVLPRVVGLLIALPLLTVWASIFGVLGGMVMTERILDISYHQFLERFANVISLKTYWVGMSKTPIFALIISIIGCYQGFRVSLSADSVGRQTTKSVVQSIFLIIIADAIFSVIYSWLGI